ncbi:MAG: T9SS type A sorting domain-containing protein [Chitinophagales bacterium]|nr:T9SS type A sorting domain-containing protein [Chitinophagales bacterium]
MGEKFYLGNDTTLPFFGFENYHYRTVWYQKTYSGINCDGVVTQTNVNVYPSIVGFIREDSLKKVWFWWFYGELGYCAYLTPPYYGYDYYYNDPEYLLYDFSLVPGDTMHFLYGDKVLCCIDSIQLLNGEWRRRFQFGSDDVIEGIGFKIGLFGSFNDHFECGSELYCYRKNGEWLYSMYSADDDFYCDSVLSGVSKLTLKYSFSLSPNPATDFLTINFTSPNFSSAQIEITDVLGRNLWSEEIESGKPLQIPVEKLSSNNIIFCQLWKEGELIEVKKVLISK